MPKTDFQCSIAPSRYLAVLYGGLWALGLLVALLGPFLGLAKLFFVPVWGMCGWRYWRKYHATQHFCQLRYNQGHLLMVSQGGELELITLVGQQRILPWLVELNICRDTAQHIAWPIAAGVHTAGCHRRWCASA